MIVTPDDTGLYLNIHYESNLEYEQTQSTFTRKIRDWKFRTKGKNWDGSVRFMKDNGRRIPLGLWKELRTMCQTFNWPCKLQQAHKIFDTSIKKEDVEAFCIKIMEHNPKMAPRPEQIEAVYRSLKYRYCMLDLSVAAGKTLVQYLSIMYMFYRNKAKQVMIVCPDADLVMQVYGDFKAYSAGRFPLSSMCMVHGGSPIQDISPYKIVIGNFQSFSNRTELFFANVGALYIDECHRAGSDSMKYIFESCTAAKLRIGLSGSILIDKTADYYTLLAYLGPIVMSVKKKEIIEKGYATDINVQIIRLNYLNKDERRRLAMLRHQDGMDGEKIFRVEQNFARDSRVRTNWLCEFVIRLKGNTIIFFLDKKYGYGKRLMETIMKLDKGKEVYYIDGDVDKKTRLIYKNRMEEGNNRILIASYDTYSTGKSINNIHHIVTAESRKSEVVINQTMGRGMRLHVTKERYNWWDLVDDFSIFEDNLDNKNILLRHMDHRIKYYQSEGFPFRIIDVDLMNASETLML